MLLRGTDCCKCIAFAAASRSGIRIAEMPLDNARNLIATIIPASNHFHWIGQYSDSGDPLNPQPGFSSNDQVPERYQQHNGLSLLPGSGAFSGKLISGSGPAERPDDLIEQEYGDLRIYPIDEFFQYDNLPNTDGRSEFHPMGARNERPCFFLYILPINLAA